MISFVRNIRFRVTLARVKALLLTWGLVVAATILALKNIGPAYHESEYILAALFPIGYWPLRLWVTYSFWPALIFAAFWIAWRVNMEQVIDSYRDGIRILVIQAQGIQNNFLSNIELLKKDITDKDEKIRELNEQIAQFNIAKENKKTPKKKKSEEN